MKFYYAVKLNKKSLSISFDRALFTIQSVENLNIMHAKDYQTNYDL